MSLLKTAESTWMVCMWPPPRGDPQLSPLNQAREGFFIAAAPLGEKERRASAPTQWDQVPHIWGAQHPQKGEQGGDKSLWPLSKAAQSGSGLV